MKRFPTRARAPATQAPALARCSRRVVPFSYPERLRCLRRHLIHYIRRYPLPPPPPPDPPGLNHLPDALPNQPQSPSPIFHSVLAPEALQDATHLLHRPNLSLVQPQNSLDHKTLELCGAPTQKAL